MERCDVTKILDEAVTQRRDGLWDFACPGVQGSLCGDVASGTPFVSAGWPTKKAATARGAQHFAEHKGEGAMQEIHDFRTDQGLAVDADGNVVRLEDL